MVIFAPYSESLLVLVVVVYEARQCSTGENTKKLLNSVWGLLDLPKLLANKIRSRASKIAEVQVPYCVKKWLVVLLFLAFFASSANKPSFG